MKTGRIAATLLILAPSLWSGVLQAAPADTQAGAPSVPAVADVASQPLGANAERVIQAMDFLGQPLPERTTADLRQAIDQKDPGAVQRALDPLVFLTVTINPELRVSVARGPRKVALQQNGYTAVLIKVLNRGGATSRLHIASPQGGPVYAMNKDVVTRLRRLREPELTAGLSTADANPAGRPSGAYAGHIFDAALFTDSPMNPYLSGLGAEYAIALISCTAAGPCEGTFAFDIGQGSQDLGFRAETSLLFRVQPAIPVTFSIHDYDGAPSIARLVILDREGRIYPSQPKRLAPDLFFEPQIYRQDGDQVRLPPATFDIAFSRGPEYRVLHRTLTVPESGTAHVDLRLERWVNPAQYGYFSGDTHIHAAGCAHYDAPMLGIGPADVLRQVKGEGLNVGDVLTWADGYEHQAQFFRPGVDPISQPLTVLKWDIEVSGFGSAQMGHIVLLDLKTRDYPGTNGTTQGWPTWTIPALRWAKDQGGVVGYPHTDMLVDPPAYARRYIARHSGGGKGWLTRQEAESGLLPLPFSQLDVGRSGRLTLEDLTAGADRAANQIPNLVLPSMEGGGAMEIFIAASEGVCDFDCSMNTGRVGEWNTWYHLLNCGMPIALAGETDWPCMDGANVGQGRTYVKLADGPLAKLDYDAWCRGLAAGRSYVSDGYAHALAFTVNDVAPGTGGLLLSAPASVAIKAKVAFAPEVPKGVAYGTLSIPGLPRREIGTTRDLYASPSRERVKSEDRLVEIVENGIVVASAKVPADGRTHELSFNLPVSKSSWIALREFPELHTNPVDVLVGGRPIRASADSARWCAESVELLWENRSRFISPSERPAAHAAYERAIALYRQRAAEAASL